MATNVCTNQRDDNKKTQRKTGEQSTDGYGFQEFIPYIELTPRYLKDDCLMFCIKEVKDKSV